MISSMTTLMLNILPWACGSLMLYLGVGWKHQKTLATHLILVGSGTYLGYLSFAVFMHLLQLVPLPVFSFWLCLMVTAATGLFWLLGFKSGNTQTLHDSTRAACQKESSIEPLWITVFLIVWLTLLIAFVLSESMYRPAVAWDTLTRWALDGYYFLDSQSNAQIHQKMSNATHPATIRYIGAWGAGSALAGSGQWLYLPWAVAYIGATLTIIGLSRALGNGWPFAVFMGILIASAPLVIAQVSLGGYADIWVALACFHAIAWLIIIDKKMLPKPIASTASLAFIASIAVTKGPSIIYMLFLITAIFLTYFHHKKGIFAIALTAIAFLVIGILISHYGVQFNLFGTHFAFLPEQERVIIGARKDTLSQNPWDVIFSNLWHAVIVKSSFNIVAIAIIPFIIPLILMAPGLSWSARVGLTFNAGTAIFVIFALRISANHFYDMSMPETDVSLSRALLVIYLSVWPTILIIMNKLRISHRNQPAQY